MIQPRNDRIAGENRVPVLLAGIIAPHVPVLLLMIARMVSRIIIMSSWGWDDFLIILAWLNSLASMIQFAISTRFGQGYHIYHVPEHLLSKAVSASHIPLINYQLSLCLTKLSILAFYLRIFPGTPQRRVTLATILSWVAITIALFFSTLFECSPVSGKFDENPSIKCIDYRPVVRASAILHVLGDAWLIIMVIPALWNLKLPRRQKLALIGVLSLGVFVIITAIARIIAMVKAFDSADLTWVMTDVYIWSTWESAIGIICACAPTIRPLLKRAFPKFMGSLSGGSEAQIHGGSEFHRNTTGIRGRSSAAVELGSRSQATAIKAVKGRGSGWQVKENCSEEDLVSMQNGIMKSTEYSVSTKEAYPGSAGGERNSTKQARSDVDSLEVYE